jgi:CDP-glycerol glycerophosphotransferase
VNLAAARANYWPLGNNLPTIGAPRAITVRGVPRLSVVVPIHNVERYLPECLESLVRQGMDDFEAILVDDGSPDGSGAIAERYAERDPRFRLVRQENGGLGSARNTGAVLARGEFLAFLDSDDAVPPGAYARMIASLDRTGSDFATGNIHRFDSRRTWPARFVAKAFLVPQRRTHASRQRWLLSDRMAQNKVWRRSFWLAHDLRFPVGVLHEDIPVILPAHVRARSVDVISSPVYLYRERDGDGVRSITQRRTEMRSLLDRLSAVERVSEFLDGRAPARLKRWYDESVVEDDLRYHLDVLDATDGEYRAVFLERANAFLDQAGPGVEDRLPAIQRLKWHLVRRRLLPELLEVVRFQKAGGAARKARAGGRVHGEYPFFEDRGLGIPRSVFRLDTARRRTRHLGALMRPYVTPHAPLQRRPRELPLPTPLPSAGALASR